MKMIEIRQLTFRYPGANKPAIDEISLSIESGEFVLVTGPSGSGKSTLLRCLNGLVPHFSGGELSGSVNVAGSDVISSGPMEMSRKVGFVFQSPESQAVLDIVEEEIAFGLENTGVSSAEMQQCVRAIMRELNISQLRKRQLTTLSSGEKQMVAIASALVMEPKLLVLDEPISQLDPDSAGLVLKNLQHINRALGLTIVVVEQRVDNVANLASRLLYLADGRIPLDSPMPQAYQRLSTFMPLGDAGVMQRPSDLHRRQDRQSATRSAAEASAGKSNGSTVTAALPPPPKLLDVKDLYFDYGHHEILSGIDIYLREGEAVALEGANGSGKSTLLRCIVGLLKPRSGTILHKGRVNTGRSVADICQDVAYLPQVPDDLLFAETVEDELDATLRNHGLDPAMFAKRKLDLLLSLELEQFRYCYPRDLSVGQRQRLAMAALMIVEPALILLDEPTRGLDLTLKMELLEVWRRWLEAGRGLLLVTHDNWLSRQIADRILFLQEGRTVEKRLLDKRPVGKRESLELFSSPVNLE